MTHALLHALGHTMHACAVPRADAAALIERGLDTAMRYYDNYASPLPEGEREPVSADTDLSQVKPQGSA